MVQIGQDGNVFDAGSIEPNTSFDPLPPGWYAMRITSSEWKPTSKGDGHYLQMVLEIDETHHPEHKGRRVWERLNLKNPNQTAVEISQRTLSAICRAAGVMQLGDTDQLHGIPIAVQLKVKAATERYEATNEVKGYDAVSVRLGRPGGPPVAPSSTKAPAPAAGKAPWA
jgi:hypothetical protein